jgi:DNA recombination protein RmuC
VELEAALRTREDQLRSLYEQHTQLKERASELSTQLTEERKATEEKLAILDSAHQKLSDAFKALSSEALASNNQSFLVLAKSTLEKFQEGAKGDLEMKQKAIEELVRPMRESLEKVDGKIQELEKVRTTAYVSLTEQIKSMASTQTHLREETSNLVKALRAPAVRGRWGEIQLKRVVEIAAWSPIVILPSRNRHLVKTDGCDPT